MSRHVLAELQIGNSSQLQTRLEFLVDTGFTGEIILPEEIVAELGLQYETQMTSYLADGSAIQTHVFNAIVLWHGEQRQVEILALGDRPLLGMSMLEDNDIAIRCRDHGLVEIETIGL